MSVQNYRTIPYKVKPYNDSLEFREDMWFTSNFLNEKIRYFENMLLLCRGLSYEAINEFGERIIVEEADVKTEALELIRAAQIKNCGKYIGNDEEVLGLLRYLYETLVASSKESIEETSDSEDDDSEDDEKLDEIKAAAAGKANTLSSEFFNPLFDPYCSKGKTKGIFSREKYKIRDEEKKFIRKYFWEDYKLIPLCDVGTTEDNKKFIITAFRIALGHVISWESLNILIKKDRKKLNDKCEKLREELKEYDSEFNSLTNFENEQFKLFKLSFPETKKICLYADNAYDHFNEISKKWELKKWELKKNNSYVNRCEVLEEYLLKENVWEYDIKFLNFLLEDSKDNLDPLWKKGGGDFIQLYLKLNQLKVTLDRRKNESLMTFADVNKHPRSIIYEACIRVKSKKNSNKLSKKGGSNLSNYELKKRGRDLDLVLVLLHDQNTSKEYTVFLEDNKIIRLKKIYLEKDDKGDDKYPSAIINYQKHLNGEGEFAVKLKTSEIQYKREDLKKGKGKFSEIFFNLVLDFGKSKSSMYWNSIQYFLTPSCEVVKVGPKKEQTIVENPDYGLRALTVDLGCRIACACSVFELGRNKSPKMSYKIDEEYYANHERSFGVIMDGEDPTKGEKEKRRIVDVELRRIKILIRALGKVLRFPSYYEEIGTYAKEMEWAFGVFRKEDKLPKEDMVFLDEFEKLEHKNIDQLSNFCQALHDKLEKYVIEEFCLWIKKCKKKPRSYAEGIELRGYKAGLSLWGINNLKDQHYVKKSFATRARVIGDKSKTVPIGFDKKFTDHIGNLLEDRINKTVCEIVKAAFGITKNGKTKKPVHIVLFENLETLKFSKERSRFENKRLALMSHRKVFKKTKAQLELYGIFCTDSIPPDYTSQFHALTGTPGVRLKTLDDSCFNNGLPNHYTTKELYWLVNHKDLKNDQKQISKELSKVISSGSIVPWAGGKDFGAVIKDENGLNKLIRIDSDINAAQNLQRRFWFRCREPYKIYCEYNKINEIYLPIKSFTFKKDGNKRLTRDGGAFKSRYETEKICLKKTGDDYYIENIEKYKIKKKSSKVNIRSKSKSKKKEKSKKAYVFRDISGNIFSSEVWVIKQKFFNTARFLVSRELGLLGQR